LPRVLCRLYCIEPSWLAPSDDQLATRRSPSADSFPNRWSCIAPGLPAKVPRWRHRS